ncbi:hypothetical protein ADICEAN_02466 [Cesiribacter andamanensis AMV16]|uniref:Tetratricopeptide repeat protein n=2 Tax=Cesiribacter TaxID=1133570 RepID=M7N169_9BACT|nr:hypothetical protein ADICEAN_02466 [Cesiribacter andamanensis AMV16]
MKNALLGMALFIGAFGVANAQQAAAQQGNPMTEWNWGDNKPKAQEKNALYNDSYKMGQHREAANALHWLLVNTPNLNPAIYINGVEIYDELANSAQDKAKKVVYQDSVLTLFDLRQKHFGGEADIAERKAYYAYKYYINDKTRLPMVYESLKRTADLNKENMSYANAVAFMVAMQRYKTANPKALTDDQALDYYDMIVQSLDKAQEQYPDQAENITKYKASVDDLLVKTVNVDCKFVEQNFGPRMKQNPNDVDAAKKVFKLLRAGNCSDSPLYMASLKTIYNNEKTFEMARYLYERSAKEGNSADANRYMADAISMAKTPADKGKLILEQAVSAANRGAKSEARSLAYKAIESDPSSASRAYSLIGNLYFSSNECYQQQDIVQDRAIFLAAYDMYQKAGDSNGMAKAKAQFPSKAELFDQNKQAGEPIRVGCWIGESTTLRTRD